MFGIRSLCKLSVFPRGGGGGPIYVVKIFGQIYMFYFMLGGLIPKHSWTHPLMAAVVGIRLPRLVLIYRVS